jgi:Flp pilus assembly pilin Flp
LGDWRWYLSRFILTLAEGTSGEKFMHKLKNLTCLRIWSDSRGQDLIEYALMAAFVATAAGAITPQMMVGVSQMFSRVGSVLVLARGS